MGDIPQSERRGEIGCTCSSPEEHEAMIREIDASMKHEDERAKMRQERNSFTLRAAVLSQQNGHNN